MRHKADWRGRAGVVPARCAVAAIALVAFGAGPGVAQTANPWSPPSAAPQPLYATDPLAPAPGVASPAPQGWGTAQQPSRFAPPDLEARLSGAPVPSAMAPAPLQRPTPSAAPTYAQPSGPSYAPPSAPSYAPPSASVAAPPVTSTAPVVSGYPTVAPYGAAPVMPGYGWPGYGAALPYGYVPGYGSGWPGYAPGWGGAGWPGTGFGGWPGTGFSPFGFW